MTPCQCGGPRGASIGVAGARLSHFSESRLRGCAALLRVQVPASPPRRHAQLDGSPHPAQPAGGLRGAASVGLLVGGMRARRRRPAVCLAGRRGRGVALE